MAFIVFLILTVPLVLLAVALSSTFFTWAAVVVGGAGLFSWFSALGNADRGGSTP